MIQTSDLRKGNLVNTEYGILPVHAIVFNDVQVKGKDGRILWAKEVEGVEISFDNLYEMVKNVLGIDKAFVWSNIKYLHQIQNYFYWNTFKELTINTKTYDLRSGN